jgi:hypothetical protein
MRNAFTLNSHSSILHGSVVVTSTLSVVMAFLVVSEKTSRGSFTFTYPIGVAQVVQAQLEALRRGDVFRAAENSAAFFKLMRLLATRVVEVGTTPPSSPGAWVLATARDSAL